MTVKSMLPSLRLPGLAYPRAGGPGSCSGGGGKGWRPTELTPQQREAYNWIERRDPTLLWEMGHARSSLLIRDHQGQYLMPHVLDAVFVLKDARGILNLLVKTTRNYRLSGENSYRCDREILGAVHEVLRLGHISTPQNPVVRIGREIRITLPGGSDTISFEIDGHLSSGVALEFKLATRGRFFFDRKRKEQARRYARALELRRITGVEYHITAPDIPAEVIRFLARTIPGVKIFLYASLFDQEGRLIT
jgi:hypothetical protein